MVIFLYLVSCIMNFQTNMLYFMFSNFTYNLFIQIRLVLRVFTTQTLPPPPCTELYMLPISGWDSLFPSSTAPCENVKPSVNFFFLLFLCYLFDSGMGFTARLHTGGVMMFFVSWYCMSWTMCAAKININLCADFVPRALCLCVCVYVSVCSGAQCVSVSGSGPAPAPLSLCVFVCADLFQQCSFGQALGASSLSAPVWTQKPLTTFDSVNILAPFNMQPELLCKDEEWEGAGGREERGGFWGEGVKGVVSKYSWNLTLMVLSIRVTKKKKRLIKPNFTYTFTTYSTTQTKGI